MVKFEIKLGTNTLQVYIIVFLYLLIGLKKCNTIFYKNGIYGKLW